MPPVRPNFLTIDPERDVEVLKGLASPVRVGILKLLRGEGPLNVNDISRRMALPQSTVAINVQILEQAGLIDAEAMKARKGHQKVCSARFDEILIRFNSHEPLSDADLIEVAMPVGLFTSVDVGPPCGLCTTENVVGLLDVPDSFLDPRRGQAALIWFGRGSVEYKFPNNAKLLGAGVASLEFSMELSSEAPGTNMDWPSDLTLWVNDVAVGTWTSPGDYGDKRGVYTPGWWKLAGSQYGKLTTWRIDDAGTWIDGERASGVSIADLGIPDHHSIRMRIGIDAKAKNAGGVNIFGRGFGNHDQDIVMRLRLRRETI